MKRLVLGLTAAVLAGCETLQPKVVQWNDHPEGRHLVEVLDESERELGMPTLYELTSAQEERRPEKGEVYENNSRRIKIFQSCVEVDEKTREETPYVLALGEDLVIAVISKREYVDDEYLVPGKYCYCGPFQYMTAPVVQGVQKSGTKTVRMFIEISDEEARQIKAKKKP